MSRRASKLIIIYMDDTPEDQLSTNEPVRPPEPTVSDEEIDAYLLRPLPNPLVDGDGPSNPVPASPPPPRPTATQTAIPPLPPRPAPPNLPPPPAGGYAPKRLYRDPHGKIAGVASGLAHYFNVDVAIIRLILILLTMSLLTLPVYIAAWIAIPIAPTWPPPGPPQKSRAGRLDSRTLTAAAVLVGLVVIASSAGEGPGAVIVPLILVAVGVYLLNQSDRSTEVAGVTDMTAAGPGAQDLNYSPYEPAMAAGMTAGASAPTWAYETTAPASVAAPPRRRRRLWLLFLLPLVPMAMIAGGAIAATSAQDTTVMMGEALFVPQTIAEIEESYSHSFGSVKIDLSNIDFTGEEVTVSIKNTFGETAVEVPNDVVVSVDVDNSFGEVSVFGDATDSSGVFERTPDDTIGQLTLLIDNSFGETTIKVP